ncbi:hypothetical protein TNCV_455591 [Trichonephila clavipes]|nr:hypothetical protein TNCV_455591 [Trichonephila clavipes]
MYKNALKEDFIRVVEKLDDSPLVSMEISLRTAYGQNGRCGMQPKAKHSLRAQAQLMRTETVETFELVKEKQKTFKRSSERERESSSGVAAGGVYSSPVVVQVWTTRFRLAIYQKNSRLSERILTSHCSATRRLLAKDLVILNHGQVARTTPELASPSTSRPRKQFNLMGKEELLNIRVTCDCALSYCNRADGKRCKYERTTGSNAAEM